MTEIVVNASRKYTVTIGSGLLANLGQVVSRGHRFCIVCDSNVWGFYGERLIKQLCENRISAEYFVFPAGESSKNSENYLALLNFLSANEFGKLSTNLTLIIINTPLLIRGQRLSADPISFLAFLQIQIIRICTQKF